MYWVYLNLFLCSLLHKHFQDSPVCSHLICISASSILRCLLLHRAFKASLQARSIRCTFYSALNFFAGRPHFSYLPIDSTLAPTVVHLCCLQSALIRPALSLPPANKRFLLASPLPSSIQTTAHSFLPSIRT